MIYIDGCSYSRYYWPCWADIFRYSNRNVMNLAESGSGNERIFFNLVQNIHLLEPGSKVVLQWSSWPRFDYWHDPMKWDAKGNRYYVGQFVEESKEWWSEDYLIFKTYHYVSLARKLLTDAGIEFYFMTMNDWNEHKNKASKKLGNNWDRIIQDPKMILHNIDAYAYEDEKYCYTAPWVKGYAPDGHPTIESHIKIANYVNSFLNINIDRYYVEKLEELHKTLLDLDEVNEIQKTALPYKSKQTNIY